MAIRYYYALGQFMEFKCKMCGAPIGVSGGESVVTCSFCGSVQTVARQDDERKENLFNRANLYRSQCDFDKSLASYQSIISLFPDEAEGYWGALLSKFGIEYVSDPSTHKKKPTIHRMSFESILNDPDYLLALANADALAKEEYINEANEISLIQKNILSISQKEEPFDIFICYKEVDSNGKRTKDSVLAQEIYSNLTNRGYKVFFARISLENKIGSLYEPYIFAALNSARIMLVIGTCTEYFNSTWVKNEWARFIEIMKSNPDRVLIPCYRDMDAYSMPEELFCFQAQDLSKLGFMQDLDHGIDKLMGREEGSIPNFRQYNSSGINIAALLDRAEILIGDCNYKKADELLETVLNNDPRNSRAYLLKLVIEVGLYAVDELFLCKEDLNSSHNFSNAYKFGNKEEKEKLDAIVKSVNDRKIEKKKFKIYQQALLDKRNGDYQRAKDSFYSISDFKDSLDLAHECESIIKKEEDFKNEIIYKKANRYVDKGSYNEAIQEFNIIIEYKDARKRIEDCENLIRKREEEERQKEAEALKKKEEERRLRDEKEKKKTRIELIVCFACMIGVPLAALITTIICETTKNQNIKEQAAALIDSGSYPDA